MKQEIGSLLRLYLDDIEIDDVPKIPEYLILGASEAIEQAQGNHYSPVIVTQIGDSKYKVVANSFVYLAVKRAGLDRIWCITVDDSGEIHRQAKIMARELTPRINLATASYEDIRMGLDYLINRPVNNLVKVRLANACRLISEVSKDKWKSSLAEITKLKCGITKGKKLDIFKEVFHFTPIAISTPNPVPSGVPIPKADPDPVLDRVPTPVLQTFSEPQLKKLTVKELKELTKERKIPRYSKLKKAELIQVLLSYQQ